MKLLKHFYDSIFFIRAQVDGTAISLPMKSYELKNAVSYPSLIDYVRATFPVREISLTGNPKKDKSVALMSISMMIAKQCRRGAGSHVYVDPANVLSLGETGTRLELCELVGLEPNEAFIVYDGKHATDTAFYYWEEDGVVKILDTPESATYGVLLRFA